MACNTLIGQIFEPAFNNGGGGGTTNHAILTNRDAADQHPISAITGLVTSLDGKAATVHTHVIADITNLQPTLDGKATISHSHVIADITNLQTTLDGKAASSHTHTIANITGLQTSLDGKAATVHTHVIADITNLQTTLDGKALASDLSNHLVDYQKHIDISTNLPNNPARNDFRFVAYNGNKLGVVNNTNIVYYDTTQNLQIIKNAGSDAALSLTLSTGASNLSQALNILATPTGAASDVKGIKIDSEGMGIDITAGKGSCANLYTTKTNVVPLSIYARQSTGNLIDVVGGGNGSNPVFSVDTNGKIYSYSTIQIQGGSPAVGKYLQCADVNGNAVWATISASALTNFAESRTTTSPNTTIPAHQLIPLGAETNIDFVLTPKGTGALLAQIPVNGTTGGVKRGNNAVDFQMSRSNSAQVASGQYAVLGGGIDNTASGTRSCVTGGKGNTASGGYSAIGGGDTNVASSTYDTVAGGFQNNASGTHSVIAGGTYNQAGALKSSITGGTEAKTTLYGERAFTSGKIFDVGDCQFSEFILKKETTGTGAAELTLDNSSSRLVMPNYTAWQVKVRIVANKSTGGVNAASAVRQFLAIRGNGANTIQLSAIDTIGTDKTIGTFEAYTISITADTVNGAIGISVTPGSATKTRWVAYVSIVQQGAGISFS